ncbi:hypothetical protein Tco_1286433 [Tanacetum coccineum]
MFSSFNNVHEAQAKDLVSSRVVLDKPSDHSSSSSSDSEHIIENITSDEVDDIEKVDASKRDEDEQEAEEHVKEEQAGEEQHVEEQGTNVQTGDAYDEVHAPEYQLEKPEATKVSSRLTLSYAE